MMADVIVICKPYYVCMMAQIFVIREPYFILQELDFIVEEDTLPLLQVILHCTIFKL